MKLYHLNRVNRSSEYQQFTTIWRLFSIHSVSRIKNSFRIQANITNFELLFAAKANISKVVDDQWLFSLAINMFPFIFIFIICFLYNVSFQVKTLHFTYRQAFCLSTSIEFMEHEYWRLLIVFVKELCPILVFVFHLKCVKMRSLFIIKFQWKKKEEKNETRNAVIWFDGK